MDIDFGKLTFQRNVLPIQTAARRRMLKRGLDEKGTAAKERRSGAPRLAGLWDVRGYVTVHVVTHDVLLVTVRSRDFQDEQNRFQLTAPSPGPPRLRRYEIFSAAHLLDSLSTMSSRVLFALFPGRTDGKDRACGFKFHVRFSRIF